MKNLKEILKSFFCAMSGLYKVISGERNFRIHIVVAAYVFVFARYFSLSKTDYALLFIVVSLVLCFEIFNTAIERIVNYLSPKYNIFAKTVKDIAAGGVFLSATFAAAVGAIYFFKIDVISFIFKDIISSGYKSLAFSLSIVLSIKFIWGKTHK